MLKQRRILKVVSNDKEFVMDDMIEEDKILLYANEVFINEFVCLKESIEELVLGYMIDLELINLLSQVEDYQINDNVVKVKYSEKNINDNNYDREKLDLDLVNQIMKNFNEGSLLFQKTGAIHTYGLYDNTNKIVIKEDVGRHNALDKMIGYALMNNIDLHNKIIVTSGRLTYEIASKLKKHPIKAIISISTPTINGANMFDENNITAIGFARNNRFNVYTNLDLY